MHTKVTWLARCYARVSPESSEEIPMKRDAVHTHMVGDREMGCHMCPIPLFVSISNGSCELSVLLTAEWFTRYVVYFPIQFEMNEGEEKNGIFIRNEDV